MAQVTDQKRVLLLALLACFLWPCAIALFLLHCVSLAEHKQTQFWGIDWGPVKIVITTAEFCSILARVSIGIWCPAPPPPFAIAIVFDRDNST